jgi:hypothetical protein
MRAITVEDLGDISQASFTDVFVKALEKVLDHE